MSVSTGCRAALLSSTALLVSVLSACGGSSSEVAEPQAPARVLCVEGLGQSAIAGTELANALVAKVLDAKDKPIQGQIVNFRVVSGGGQVFAGAAITDKSGLARERWTLGMSLGIQRMEARAVDPKTGAALVFATFEATAVPGPPSFTLEPRAAVASVGQQIHFEVAVDSLVPATFQWFRDGRQIDGATGSTLTLASVAREDGGAVFSARADNGWGSATSTSASLTIRGFWPAASLANGRTLLTATPLPNGQVLLAGGMEGGRSTDRLELFDPITGAVTPAGALHFVREYHTATLLPSGSVLFVGGTAGGWSGTTLDEEAEVLDPATGASTTVGPVVAGHYGAAATALLDGRVLVTGGAFSARSQPTTEVFDPATLEFTQSPSMTDARAYHGSERLPDGRVLVFGGYDSPNDRSVASAELYDPATGTFAPTGGMIFPRYGLASAPLPGGKILVAGGYDQVTMTFHATAEIYDPATGLFTRTGDMTAPRYLGKAASLPSGEVLLIGGSPNGLDPSPSAEVFDPSTGTFSRVGDMATPRYSHAVAPLPSGDVLVAGGNSDASGATTASVERFDPRRNP